MLGLLLLPVLLGAYFYGVRVGYRAAFARGFDAGKDAALRAVMV